MRRRVPEVTGLLIPTGNPEAITEAVLILLGDPDRCKRMSVAARTWVAENYEDRRVLGLAVVLYLRLIAHTDVQISKTDEKRTDAVTGLPAAL